MTSSVWLMHTYGFGDSQDSSSEDDGAVEPIKLPPTRKTVVPLAVPQPEQDTEGTRGGHQQVWSM